MLTPITVAAEPLSATAAVLRDHGGDFTLEGVRLEAPRSDEVLVRVVATGMCHTDLLVRDGHLPTPLPAVVGHEGAGIVVATGSTVHRVKVGDHVVMTYLSCGSCRECHDGAPASCASLGALCFGGSRADGTHAICGHDGALLNDRFFGQSSFATYAMANERNVVKVRGDAPLELLGPLGCGVLTGAGAIWNALCVGPGSSVAVFGAGAVGMSAIMAAHLAGAATIVAIDRVASRLDLALELGATHAVDAGTLDVLAAVRGATWGGADFALDTTGRPEVVRTAVLALRQRGVAAMVALGESPPEFDMLDLLAGCKTIKGVIEGEGAAQLLIPKLVDLHMAGRFPFDRLVRFYRPDQMNEAVRDSIGGEVIKPIIRFVSEASLI